MFMKKYRKLLLFALIVPFVLFSCKDDDEDPNAALVGTWEEKSYVSSSCADADNNETYNCSASCERMVITKNTISVDGDPAIPYTVSGDKITISESSGGLTISITVTFNVSGNTLTLTRQDDPSDGGCKHVSTYTRI